ncbi:hypothetical protein PS2_020543 [Malus domestica]
MPTEDVSAKKEKKKISSCESLRRAIFVLICRGSTVAECLVFIVAAHQARVPILFGLGLLLRITIPSISPISARTTNLVLN